MTPKDLETYKKYKNKFETIESISRKALRELEKMWRDGFLEEARLNELLSLSQEQHMMCSIENNPFNDLGKTFNV